MTTNFSIPLTPETAAIAARVIWFEPPEQALADGVRFFAYAFRYATPADMRTLRALVSEELVIAALTNAPPRIIDPRSWWYWHLMLLDQAEPPPMPERRYG